MTYTELQRVHVKNFQSIADTTLELGGLTVLVGPGDAGKSAILRALRALCLNDASDDDIRHGEKRATVTLTDEDGTVIEWWKERGVGGCYRAFGKEFTKTGGEVPVEIAEYLGIGRIEVDATTELTPQLSDQFDSPFIIWETGSRRARILGKATRLDVVVTAQMACKKNLDTHRREAERADRELEEVMSQLASLPDVPALTRRLNEVEATRALVVSAFTLVDRARELGARLAEVRSRAQAVDVSAQRNILRRSIDLLERAELCTRLREERREVGIRRMELAVKQGELKTRREEYEAACEEAGVCSVCGGLLTHEECGVIDDEPPRWVKDIVRNPRQAVV